MVLGAAFMGLGVEYGATCVLTYVVVRNFLPYVAHCQLAEESSIEVRTTFPILWIVVDWCRKSKKHVINDSELRQAIIIPPSSRPRKMDSCLKVF